ncbi:hypothetical protein MPSEU_000700100 [Mayamaea pseudoterrestris]|nr:hypothetical protein MPSEU_000700100 [Mayamaea pseudoterrestris]
MKVFVVLLATVAVLANAQVLVAGNGSKGKGIKGMRKPQACKGLEDRPFAICFEYCDVLVCPTRTAGNKRCKVLRKKFFRKEKTRVFPCDLVATAAPNKSPVAKAPVAKAPVSKAPVAKTPVAPPVNSPSGKPSSHPSGVPSVPPSQTPSKTPSTKPSSKPSSVGAPSVTPSQTPSTLPSVTPSIRPSSVGAPSVTPSQTPSITPSVKPSSRPSSAGVPSVTPSQTPSITPSVKPSSRPSSADPSSLGYPLSSQAADHHLWESQVLHLESALAESKRTRSTKPTPLDSSVCPAKPQAVVGSFGSPKRYTKPTSFD